MVARMWPGDWQTSEVRCTFKICVSTCPDPNNLFSRRRVASAKFWRWACSYTICWQRWILDPSKGVCPWGNFAGSGLGWVPVKFITSNDENIDVNQKNVKFLSNGFALWVRDTPSLSHLAVLHTVRPWVFADPNVHRTCIDVAIITGRRFSVRRHGYSLWKLFRNYGSNKIFFEFRSKWCRKMERSESTHISWDFTQYKISSRRTLDC